MSNRDIYRICGLQKRCIAGRKIKYMTTATVPDNDITKKELLNTVVIPHDISIYSDWTNKASKIRTTSLTDCST